MIRKNRYKQQTSCAKTEGFRPTTTKVRQAIFNSLQFELQGKTVCDLFAGSGAFGIEALKRGAASCTFVDINKKLISDVKKTLDTLHIDKALHAVLCEPVDIFIENSNTNYEIIFMDPPYNKKLIMATILQIFNFNILDTNGKLIVEHHKDEKIDFQLLPPRAKLLKEKEYGDTMVSFMTAGGR